MAEQGARRIVWVLLAAVCFAIALLAAFGVILARDDTGRIIYGVVWSLLGVSWLARYVVARRRPR